MNVQYFISLVVASLIATFIPLKIEIVELAFPILKPIRNEAEAGILSPSWGDCLHFSSITQNPISISIFPNLEQARDVGFHLLVGKPPFEVNFDSRIEGGNGELTYAWDFDGDQVIDSEIQNPGTFTYHLSGEYLVTLSVTDENNQFAIQEQRIIVIGETDYPDWCYGVTDHLNKSFGLYNSPSERVEGLNLIESAGIQAVRLDYPWTNIEPEQNDTFVWEDYDELTKEISGAGLEIVALLTLTPRWASSGDENSDDWGDWGFAAPRNPPNYADYVYHVVDRYKSDIHYWEIGNEPNLSKYFRDPNSAIYTEMLKRAYWAAKYADPNSIVIAGALANDDSIYSPQYTWISPEKFLKGMYENGAKGHFDVLSRHPYNGGPNDFRGPFLYTSAQLNTMRTLLDSHGDDQIPIWITEYGISRDKHSEEVQATFLEDSLEFLFGNKLVDVLIWYNFRSTNTGNAWADGLGILSNDLSPLPAYEMYSEYISQHNCP